jgi:hypothetical protein
MSSEYPSARFAAAFAARGRAGSQDRAAGTLKTRRPGILAIAVGEIQTHQMVAERSDSMKENPWQPMPTRRARLSLLHRQRWERVGLDEFHLPSPSCLARNSPESGTSAQSFCCADNSTTADTSDLGRMGVFVRRREERAVE